MKCFIVLAACLVSVVSAGHLGGYHAAGPIAHGHLHAPVVQAPVLTGQSSQFREEDSYGNYKFGYDESHASGGSGRREERHGDVVTGSYNLAVHDGRARRVDYISDKYGFRATVSTNEEGVDSSRDPAAVLINKHGAPLAPIVEAPLAPLAGPAYGAPLAAPAPLPAPLPVAPVYAPGPRVLAAPAPIAVEAPVAVIEAPREAFTYSFGTHHASPIGYAAPAPLALPAPAPIALPVPAPAPAPVALRAYPAPAPVAAAPIFQHGLKY